jgi:hypothetical protein
MTSKKRMRIKKTRKLNENKKKTRRHKFIRKNRFFGGDNLTTDSKADEIMNEVKKERELKMNFNLGDYPVIKKSRELVEGLTIKGIEHLGILLGVDLSSSQSINERLEKIRLAFTDPKNQEKVREILNEAANVGNVAIEAASPFIKPLIDKTVDLGSEALSKLGESAVKIGLNTAEEIPGVGVVLGTVRSLNDAGEAILAASNAASEVVTTTSDSINAATKNFERLIKEKMQGLNRINESVNNFQTPFNRDQLLKIASSKAPNLTGGNIGKKYKKMKPISI